MKLLLVSVALLLAVGQQSDAQKTGERYLASIYQKIATIKPKGNVSVMIDIESTGHVSALRVVQSSGDPGIDESVLLDVLSASPFGPLPEELRPRLTEVKITTRAGPAAK